MEKSIEEKIRILVDSILSEQEDPRVAGIQRSKERIKDQINRLRKQSQDVSKDAKRTRERIKKEKEVEKAKKRR